ERRLVMIMRERVPCNVPLRWLLIVGLLALIALPGWSSGQPAPRVAQEPASTRPTSEPVAPLPASNQPGSTSSATAAPSPTTEVSTSQNQPSTPTASEPALSRPALPPGPSTSLERNAASSPTGGSSADRDRRLLELENKLDALLREVRALRA